MIDRPTLNTAARVTPRTRDRRARSGSFAGTFPAESIVGCHAPCSEDRGLLPSRRCLWTGPRTTLSLVPSRSPARLRRCSDRRLRVPVACSTGDQPVVPERHPERELEQGARRLAGDRGEEPCHEVLHASLLPGSAMRAATRSARSRWEAPFLPRPLRCASFKNRCHAHCCGGRGLSRSGTSESDITRGAGSHGYTRVSHRAGRNASGRDPSRRERRYNVEGTPRGRRPDHEPGLSPDLRRARWYGAWRPGYPLRRLCCDGPLGFAVHRPGRRPGSRHAARGAAIADLAHFDRWLRRAGRALEGNRNRKPCPVANRVSPG